MFPCRHRAYGLLRQSAPRLVPRSSPQHQVGAGGGQPLRGEGPSRRSLCVSVPACLDLSPGGPCGACTRFFPHDSGLPPVRTGSALPHVRTATSVRHPFRGCSHARMVRPAGVLTTPVAPTATDTSGGQPWFFRPSLSWVVPSPRPGYATRLNRAIDGRGTFTLLDTQPVVRPGPRVMCAFPQGAPHAYWITSVAWNRSIGGMVIPRALAVLRLMTNSNCMACSTGRSAGFTPRRILST